MPDDVFFMRRALELAQKGQGRVEPNPMVGAVLVRDGQIIGEGFHEQYGQAHAEVNAIAQAGERSRGATLFVSLEPCCHQGKTPPCTDAVLRAGIVEVVAAMPDPFPLVAGKGAAQLQHAGVALRFGPCQAEAMELNAPYLTLLKHGRPYVHAKWAMTLDGKIATRTGDSQWISNEASRRRVHELRGRMDAILVGIGTALADDPLLTARPPGPRLAARVIVDSKASLPLSSRLVQTARDVPTLVVAAQAEAERLDALCHSGCEVLVLPGAEGRVDVRRLLEEMGKRRWTNLLVEGGGQVLGSLHDARWIDEAHVFIAPKLIGGAAPTPLAGHGFATLASAPEWSMKSTVRIDEDVYVRVARRD